MYLFQCIYRLGLLCAVAWNLAAAQVFSIVGPSTFNENQGTVQVVFQETISPICGGPVCVVFIPSIEFEAGPAAADADDFNSLTLSPVVGNVGENYTVEIQLKDDTIFEQDETFILRLTPGGTISDSAFNFTITITSDDPELQALTVPENLTVTESAGFDISVFLKGPDSRPITQTKNVQFQVTSANGTAMETDDFIPIDSTMEIAAGQSSLNITVGLVDDDIIEDGVETFTVMLSQTVPDPGKITIDQNYTIMVRIKDNERPVFYECTRTGQECGNGMCENGMCTCNPGFDVDGLPDCNVADTDVVLPASACTADCVEANSVCLVSGADNVCKCRPGWQGAKCDMPAHKLVCTSTHFEICITPYGNTQMANVIKENVNACELTVGGLSGCDGFGGRIPYEASGTDPCEGWRLPGSPIAYQLSLRIRFSGTEHVDDLKPVFQCRSSVSEFGNGTTFFSVSLSEPPTDPVPINNPDLTNSNFEPVIPVSFDEFGSQVGDTSNLREGSVLRRCYIVSPSSGFEEIIIDRIAVNNKLERDDPLFVEIELYDQGCPLSEGITDPKWEDETVRNDICFFWTVQKLPNTFDLQLLVEYTVAAGVDLTPHICATGRKRRQTSPREKHGQTETVFTLQRNQLSEEAAILKECERSWLIPAVISLGIVCATMLVIVIILAATVIKHNRAKKIPQFQ